MFNKTLKFAAWNINGCISRSIGLKFFDPDFKKTLKEADVVCLTETHVHEGNLEYLNIPGFRLLGHKNQKKNLRSNTAPVGIAIFVKEKVAKLFTILKSDNEDVIWLKLKKEQTGMSQDVFIATCYLSPAREKRNSDSKIWKLSEEVMSYQEKRHVIINGDLNAWVGVISDVIKPDKFDEYFQTNNRDVPPARNSKHRFTN